MSEVIDFFAKLFDSSDWPPRWHCGKWTAFHGWLYILSDLLIWSAYFAIPIVIVRYLSRKKNILFKKLYFLFAAFILACGATHLLDAIIFWVPLYRLSALVRFITGVLSWLTVFYLVKYLPIIFSLRSQNALESEIEERKKTERALEKIKYDYQLLISGVKDYAIFLLDTQGKVASWNSSAENIKGYEAAEIIGQSIDVFYTAEQQAQNEPTKDLEKAMLHGKYETAGWRVRKDGTQFWAEVAFTSLYDENKKFYGYAKVTRDFTEKRKNEENYLFLASIASNIQDPYISTDNNEIITKWNKAAEQLLGWRADEVVGKLSHDILKIDYLESTEEQVRESFNEKKYWQGEVIYHTRLGKPLNVLVTVSQLFDVDENESGYLALVRDITERKNAELALSRINVELEAFSYSISHDLRAPLRAIVGFTNILEEDYSSKLDKNAVRITGIIKSNSIKMGNLIDDLLSFSRLGRQPISKVSVDCNDIIHEIINESELRAGSSTINWVVPILPAVHADPNTVRQVWTNLLANAVKYTSKLQQPIIEIGYTTTSTEIVFFVKDNGVGFDQRYYDKLFKVFQRLHSATEFEGTGVGLAIVEKIVTKHGGKVWATSIIGEGACFYFSLPHEKVT